MSTSVVTTVDRELWGHRLAHLLGASVTSVGALLAHGTVARFETGASLASEGSPIARLHWVLDGGVEMMRHGRAFARASAGDAVGAIVAWSGDARGLSATCTVTTHTLAFDANRVSTWIGGRSPLLEAALRAVSREAVALRRGLGPDAGFVSRSIVEQPFDPSSAVARMLLVRAATGGLMNTRIEAVADLASIASFVEISSGAVLWREGETPSDWALMIASGEIAGTARTPAQSFLHRCTEAVGVLDALSGAPRWYTATVTRAVRALRFEREDLLSIIADHPELQIDLIRRMSASALAIWDR